jgi:hypothetical protein
VFNRHEYGVSTSPCGVEEACSGAAVFGKKAGKTFSVDLSMIAWIIFYNRISVLNSPTARLY